MDDTIEFYSQTYNISNTSTQSNDFNEVFPQSLSVEDDEAALKWASLDKLPTYDRLRKGILIGSQDTANVVDVKNLGFEEKKSLVNRLVTNVEDNELLLLKLKNCIERVGIQIPTIEVRFEHLNIGVEAYVRSRTLPIFTNFITNLAVGLFNLFNILPSQKKHLTILHDVSGIIKPGRFTLLLGPPSSGKTTLLLALAGKFDHDLKVSGKVTYNGCGMHEFVPQRSAAYVSQYDVHLPEMTVRETLAFSARCQGIGSLYDMIAELSRREKAANIKPDHDVDLFMKAIATEGQKENALVDYILKILGLEICADTLVGNQMIRGISGGQRKRVTTGEMLVGPVRALFMDEISTGLDSSTTFHIVNSLQQYIHILDGTAVISLLQPAPETYDLFDDIILISEGQIVYQGPCDNVLEFFDHMGFKCPERKGVADFLQEVTSRKDQQQYWARRDEPYCFVTVKEFAEAFKLFHTGCKMLRELATPFDKSKNHPTALTTRTFVVKKMELFKACLSREYLLTKRNSLLHLSRLFQLIVSAFVAMTIFLRIKIHKDSPTDGAIIMGALFYIVSRMLFMEIPEVSLIVQKLPVFYKQRDHLFFPTWAFALSHWVLRLPMALIATSIWVFTTYYVIGFDPNVGRLFKQYILLFLCLPDGIWVIPIFWGNRPYYGHGIEHLKRCWVWAYWLSPMMYAQNGIAVNEFLGKSWGHVLPNSTEPLGITILKSQGLFPYPYWYWLSVGALIGFTILSNILYTLALTFLKPLGKPQPVVQEDNKSNKFHGGTSSRHIERNLDAETKQLNKRVVLPFEKHFITFNDIRYSIDMPKEMKIQGVVEDRLELLKGVSGVFRPGVLTALMGVSGAGKTTLLDVLAGRKTVGYIDGDIKISGFSKKQKTFARISAYCEQNDIHSPHVTVYESVIYSAWLRLSPKVGRKTRQMFVEEVMELLELTPLRQALVGLPGVSGLSTEQRKRLNIAVELVANPSIIFMDEPTSGLDARAAAIVMAAIRNIVDTGRTIVCTIHQPSIDIFEAFDELFLMKHGGQEIYVGPLGRHSCHLINYFEGIPGVHKIKDGHNPAAWMLDMTISAQEHSLGVNFAEAYKNSDLYRRTKSLIEELSIPHHGSRELSFSNQYSQTFFVQFVACLWKQCCSYWHNSAYTAKTLVDTAFVALLLGAIFWDLGAKKKTMQDLFNLMGSMYVAVLFLSFRNSSTVQPVVAAERTILYRERGAGMYSAMPYALAQVMVEIPYIFAQTLLYVIIVYAMIGFEWTTPKFFWFLFFMFFTFMYSTFFGMMWIAMMPNQNLSSVFSSFFYPLWNLFSGFIIPRPAIPIWWRWYYWACPMAWSFYGLVASQYGDIKDVLEDGVMVEQFVREHFGFKHDFLGVIAAGIIGYALLFAFVFVFSFRVFNFQK